MLLSRSQTSEYTIIVGEKKFAIDKMWELITTGNQWTRYTTRILETISINEGNIDEHQNSFEYPEAYPFRRIDADLPTDVTGYVYCLTSVPNLQKVYIGQTECLDQ